MRLAPSHRHEARNPLIGERIPCLEPRWAPSPPCHDGPVIARYQLPEMAALFTDQARMGRWLEIELLATEAWAQLGVVPAADAEACRERAPIVDDGFVAAVDERERVTDHDVAAFVDVVQDRIGGSAGKWIHYGLTSSDVVDTARRWALARRRRPAGGGVGRAGRARSSDGRSSTATPPWSAAPTACTPSRRPSAPSSRCGPCRPTVTGSGCARPARPSRSASCRGAVGTYSNIDPAVERHVCAALGLQPVPATQVIARDRHAAVPVRLRLGRGDHRAHRHRDPPPAAHRGARGRGGLPGRAEGQLGHAPQAQPDHRRAPDGPGPHPAGQPAGRPRGRRAVARARHLPLLGGAGDPARLLPPRLLRAATGGVARRRPAGRRRPDARRTSTAATAWCSASRCCSRWSRAG